MAATDVIHFPSGPQLDASVESKFKNPLRATRVVILPNWDRSDKDRYDEEQTRRKHRAAVRRRRRPRTRLPHEAATKKGDRS